MGCCVSTETRPITQVEQPKASNENNDNDSMINQNVKGINDENITSKLGDMGSNATDKHHKKHKILYDMELVEWIESKQTDFIIIDVRNSNMDYLGGHINGAINIEHTGFIKKLKEMIDENHKVGNIVFHCMYSQCRGPTCCSWYCMAITALLDEFQLNNNDNNNQNHYKESKFMNECLNESGDFGILFDIEMDKEKYSYLCNQNIYVLHLGFVNFVNQYRDNKRLIADFDESFWSKHKYSNMLTHKNDW